MLILYNAKIYTLDPAKPTASAIAIRDGRIIAIGNDVCLRAEFEGQGTHLDLHGQPVIPGLIDAHIHLEKYALGLQKVDCETSTRQECLSRVEERARRALPGEWIMGHGWNQNSWSDGFGTAKELDTIVPDHPVYLTAKSLHAAWANTTALRLAGLTDQTPDPLGGFSGEMHTVSLTVFSSSQPWILSTRLFQKRLCLPLSRLSAKSSLSSGKWA